MKVIYKYPLQVADYQEVLIPMFSKILTVQIQNDLPVLWALVDTEVETEYLSIRLIPTGYPMANKEADLLQYISTIQTETFGLVFHVFKGHK